jgi:hypothetical protein
MTLEDATIARVVSLTDDHFQSLFHLLAFHDRTLLRNKGMLSRFDGQAIEVAAAVGFLWFNDYFCRRKRLGIGEAACDLQFNAWVTLALAQNHPVSNFDEMRLKAATPMAQKLFRPRKVLPSSRTLRHADECEAWCQCYKIFFICP